MNISEDTFDKNEIENWLKLIGATPNEVDDKNMVWHLEFDYPTKSQERMHILCTESHQIAIATQINVSPQHIKAFDELPADEQREFSLSLRHELTRPEADFKLEGSKGMLECPTSILLSRVRFRDGITLDSFYESIGHVFKTKMSAILFINKSLQEQNSGGNKFGFKTMPN